MKNFIQISVFIITVISFSLADFVKMPLGLESQWLTENEEQINISVMDNNLLYVFFVDTKHTLLLMGQGTEKGWVYTNNNHSCFISFTSKCEGNNVFPSQRHAF
jgi:hypothetical protein